ncbi:hypothetical protein MXB_2130 [Myxobolus squamalis]|nr:hypothetical protein MXB_2130 [Myxobolus squamalis]
MKSICSHLYALNNNYKYKVQFKNKMNALVPIYPFESVKLSFERIKYTIFTKTNELYLAIQDDNFHSL